MHYTKTYTNSATEVVQLDESNLTLSKMKMKTHRLVIQNNGQIMTKSKKLLNDDNS